MSWNYPQSSAAGVTTPPELEDYVRVQRHPVALAFHLAFRIGTIVVYLFCSWLTSSFIISFVVVTFLSCLDFWTVKNISGRLLAGLRWWNQVDDEGNSQWVFEQKQGAAARDVVPYESRVFWASLFAVQIVWALLLLIKFLTFDFKWFLLVGVAFIMSGANLYGYIRCVIGNTSTAVTDYLKPKLLSSVFKAAAASTEQQQQQQRPQQPLSTGMTGTVPTNV